MPRQARLDAPGALHHIIIRGIERRRIFKDDKDRDNLIQRLEMLLPETQTKCYAWAFLPNHAHFLLRSGPKGISNLMGRLLTGYAVYFNRKHKRHGPLFQNRYKSILCQENLYFMELVRYIHLNPLRAKIVSDLKELQEFPYCGHGVIMGERIQIWQDTDYVLLYFGTRTRKAKLKYLTYMEEGINQGRRSELTGGGLIRSFRGWGEIKRLRQHGYNRIKGDERILGDSGFVSAILSQANEDLDRRYELKVQGYDFKKVMERVCEIYRLKPEEIYKKDRRKIQVEARGLLCYWANRELNIRLTELARRLNMTQPGVGYAVTRGEKIVREKGLDLFNQQKQEIS